MSKQVKKKIARWFLLIFPCAIFTAFILFFLVSLCGCDNLEREQRQFLKFSEFAPSSLFKVKCQGNEYRAKGLFFCEEKGRAASTLNVKVMPFIGTLTESNGQTSKTNDFNWAEKRFLIWKSRIINETWIDLDTNKTIGIHPNMFSVIGKRDNGITSNSGLYIHSLCNDIETPCTHLKVEYECNGEKISSGDLRPIVCIKQANSEHVFKITHSINEGSEIIATNEATGQIITGNFTEEIRLKSVPGPNLIGIRVLNKIGDQYYPLQMNAIIVTHNKAWVGIDNPHFTYDKETDKNGNFARYYINWYKPFNADFIEVITDGKREVSEESVRVSASDGSCAYAYSRERNDASETCVDSKGVEIKKDYRNTVK
jgi:hypothetical protein